MWILFATGQYPRGLNIHGDELNASYGDTLTRMLGTEEWIDIAEARRQGIIDPATARTEWVNLMRWRLEHTLGYAASHAFTMKNTNGNDIYDMVFTTDHPVGDKIMRHLYGTALSQHEAMRLRALALRRDRRREDAGSLSLFSVTPEMVRPSAAAAEHVYVHEAPHEPYRLPHR